MFKFCSKKNWTNTTLPSKYYRHSQEQEIQYSLNIIRDSACLFYDSDDFDKVLRYYELITLHLDRLLLFGYDGIVIFQDDAQTFMERIHINYGNVSYRAFVKTISLKLEIATNLKTERGRACCVEKIFAELEAKKHLYPKRIEDYIDTIQTYYLKTNTLLLFEMVKHDANTLLKKQK